MKKSLLFLLISLFAAPMLSAMDPKEHYYSDDNPTMLSTEINQNENQEKISDTGENGAFDNLPPEVIYHIVEKKIDSSRNIDELVESCESIQALLQTSKRMHELFDIVVELIVKKIPPYISVNSNTNMIDQKRLDTLLLECVYRNNYLMAKATVLLGANPNGTLMHINLSGESYKEHWETIIFILLRRNNLGMLRFLVNLGADIDLPINGKENDNQHCPTLLTFIFEELTQAFANNNEKEIKSLSEKFKFLVDLGADINQEYYERRDSTHSSSFLTYSFYQNNFDMVKLLVECGANLDGSLYKAIDLTDTVQDMCPKVNLSTIDLSGVPFVENQKNTTSCDNGNKNEKNKKYIKIIEFLLSKGANNQQALHQAVEKKNIELIKMLVTNGADINAQNKNEKTPLHIAIANNYLEIVQYLVKHGANVNIQDDNGNTPLHIAARNKNIQLIEMFANEKNVNTQNRYGETSLQLLQRGIDKRKVDLQQLEDQVRQSREDIERLSACYKQLTKQ